MKQTSSVSFDEAYDIWFIHAPIKAFPPDWLILVEMTKKFKATLEVNQ